MERYILRNGVLLSPPRNAVAADGRAISNFDLLVARDADFAAQNGYYPKSGAVVVRPEGDYEQVFHLLDGEWQSCFIPVEGGQDDGAA